MSSKKKIFLEALKEQLGIVTAAAKQTGVNRTTHYKWLKDPKYKEQVDAIPELVLDFGENALFKLMQEKNTAAIIFFLKCKGKERGYIERSEQLIEHKGEQIKIIIEEKKPDGDKSSTQSKADSSIQDS